MVKGPEIPNEPGVRPTNEGGGDFVRFFGRVRSRGDIDASVSDRRPPARRAVFDFQLKTDSIEREKSSAKSFWSYAFMNFNLDLLLLCTSMPDSTPEQNVGGFSVWVQVFRVDGFGLGFRVNRLVLKVWGSQCKD